MKKVLLLALAVLALFIIGCEQMEIEENDYTTEDYQIATFAGGCFWCTESDFEKEEGVIEVISGFSGGSEIDPTYKEVSSGITGHTEVVQVKFNPEVVSYSNLLEIFWTHVDPTDKNGQFVDRGQQYRPAIFYHDEEQKKLAEDSRKKLEESKIFNKPITVEITKFESFYAAEDYHQDYYKKSSIRYNFYRGNSGRDQFLENTWNNHTFVLIDKKYTKLSESEIKEMLTPQQYKITRSNETEKSFDNEYWDNKEEGIYVDLISGEPLFSSKDKYVSGTGWPSFTKPLEKDNVVTSKDYKLFIPRTEVRSKIGDAHLGHVFDDGPGPDGLRWCMNSAAMKFISKDDLEEEGYGEYLELFD